LKGNRERSLSYSSFSKNQRDALGRGEDLPRKKKKERKKKEGKGEGG